jgi:hypothetical protein
MPFLINSLVEGKERGLTVYIIAVMRRLLLPLHVFACGGWSEMPASI